MKKLLILFLLLFTVKGFSARLWSSGAELNSITAGVEFSAIGSVASISTSTKRSGSYSLKSLFTTGTKGNAIHYFSVSPSQADYYARAYFYITSFPTTLDCPLLTFRDRTGPADKVSVRLKTDRTLILYNEEDVAQVGSASNPLELNKWYQIELKTNTTTLASTVVGAKIDTVTIATGTINLGAGINDIIYGVNAEDNGVITYVDDMALNNSTGSFQNTYPGYGRIVHLKPRVAGSVNNWNHKDGTAGSSTNFDEVNEITPNDVTDYVKTRNTLNDTDFYAIDSFTTKVDSLVSITLIQTGVRFADSSGTNGDDFALEVKLKGGVPEVGTTIAPISTGWNTNDPSANLVLNYTQTLYDLPGASTVAWTGQMLDTTQIGMLVNNVTGSTKTYVTSIHLLVEYGYRKVNYFMKASKDNSGQDLATLDNFGLDTVLWVGADATPTNWRGIVHFDLPGLAKGTFVVDSAFLLVYFEDEDTTTNRSIRVAGITTDPQNLDWLEGDGTLAGGYTFGSSWDSTGRPDTTWKPTAGFAPGRNLDTIAFNTPNTWIKFVIPVEWITAMLNGDSVFTGFVFINNSEGTASSRKMIASLQAGSLKACSLKIYDAQDDFGGSSQTFRIYDGNGNIINSNGNLEPNWRDMAVRVGSATSDTIVVSWNNIGGTPMGLVYSWSADSGQTWSSPIQFSPSATTTRPNMVVDVDTVYLVASNFASVTENPIYIWKFRPGGTITQLSIPDTTGGSTGNFAGIMTDLTIQPNVNGDTFWLSSRRDFNNSGSVNDSNCLWIYYSTNRMSTVAGWTLSKKIKISSASTSIASGEHQILHTSGAKVVIVTTGLMTVEGSIRLVYRNDADAQTTWQTIQDIYASANGRWAGAWTMPGDTNVIVHVLSGNGDTSKVYVWGNGAAAKKDSAVVFTDTNWIAGKEGRITNIGYMGDTIFAVLGGEITGISDNNWVRQIHFKKSVNGTTWIDSTLWVQDFQNGFDQVWLHETGDVWTNYTTASNDQVSNDLDAFNALTDTMFFGDALKYRYICFVEGTEGSNEATVIAWDYWNGSAWTPLSTFLFEPSNANFLTVDGIGSVHQIWFDVPTDWATTTVNGGSALYYVRLSISGTAFVTQPQMASVSPGIWQSFPHVVRSNPSNYFGTAYLRGGREATNTGDIMFIRYDIGTGGVAGVAKRNRTALIKLLGD